MIAGSLCNLCHFGFGPSYKFPFPFCLLWLPWLHISYRRGWHCTSSRTCSQSFLWHDNVSLHTIPCLFDATDASTTSWLMGTGDCATQGQPLIGFVRAALSRTLSYIAEQSLDDYSPCAWSALFGVGPSHIRFFFLLDRIALVMYLLYDEREVLHTQCVSAHDGHHTTWELAHIWPKKFETYVVYSSPHS